MSKSIMEPKGCRICFVCGAEGYTEEHHIFHGSANRRKSEVWGLKVHLCYLHHRDPKLGVHGSNTELDRTLKEAGQQAFEARYNRGKFMDEFGRNYLEV